MSDCQPRVVRTYRIGGHLYGLCSCCGRLIKLTGFWKGIHFCA